MNEPSMPDSGERKIPLALRLGFILVVSGIVLFAAVTILYWQMTSEMPQMISVAEYKPLGVTQIFSKDQVLMSELYKERRYLIPFERIPPLVVQAFTSAEDDSFFEHQGFNPIAMLRATIANFRAGHMVQGGSTITQQVAKSLFLSPERTILRKAKELILSSRIERNLTKQQILYLYLNQIYLGQGAYGIQAAARIYFGKDVKDLALHEIAFLGGLPKAPSKFGPFANPARAKERQQYVLRRMLEVGHITREQMTQALATPLKVMHSEGSEQRYATYVIEAARRYLVQKYGEKSVLEEGLTVILPSYSKIYKVARDSLKQGLRELDKRRGYRGSIRKLKDDAQYREFINQARDKAIRKRIPFLILTPDGRIGIEETLAAAGIKTERELLLLNEIYEGVVTSVDDKKGEAKVHVGILEARMPMERMNWAYPALPASKDSKEEVTPQAPTKPSQVVAPGDVILVKLSDQVIEPPKETVKSKGPKPPKEHEIIADLEQDPVVQGGLYSIEARTGIVLAMEGGFDFLKSEFNRATQAQRQPGSAFKPIIFSAAVERGYTPATVIVDSPLIYSDETGKWKPSNYDEKFHGDTLFRLALIHSRNIPTIKIVQDIQVPRVLEFVRRIGLQGQFPGDLSISLGSGSVSLQELTHAYALYPRLGHKVTPTYISKVIDRDGRVLEDNQPTALTEQAMMKLPAELPALGTAPEASPLAEASPTPALSPPAASFELVRQTAKLQLPPMPPADDPDWVMDPRVAFIMTQLMKEVVEFGTGQKARGLAKAVAGKTGTTNDFIDAWFMGFNPYVVTGTWVGYDDLRTLGHGETGAKTALPIWMSFMQEVVKNYPDAEFVVPPGITFASIDTRTGQLQSGSSQYSRNEAFIEGTQPSRTARSSKRVQETESEFLREDN